MGATAERVAIVGMAVLLPGADSIEGFWDNLASGYDAISDLPEGRWGPEFYDPAARRPDRVYCRRGGFIQAVDFDPLQFGVLPSSIPDTEPEQLIALQVAAAAVTDAGGADRLPPSERVGVIIGRAGSGSVAQGRFFGRVRLAGFVLDVLRQILPDVGEDRLDLVSARINETFGPFRPENVIGLTPNLTASRLANRLGLRGPAYVVDAACASSLIAVSNAVAELLGGRLDAAIVGGVHHLHDVAFWSMFAQLGALSRRGEIRPFDKAADGLLIGEATGMVLLKRLSDACRDGDRIYAVISGTGTSSDGRAASLFSPAPEGQALAIRQAWAAAGLDPAAPDALGMLEAHGTATPTGDAAELETMTEVFGPSRGATDPVIGSVKSMIGHTMAAAGIVSLIKAALAVSRGVQLPTLHCDDPHPQLERTRFAPIAAARPWTGPGPRRAAVSAFGFGGINAHIILDQAPEPPPTARARVGKQPVSSQVNEPDQVILLAAPSLEALSRLMDASDDVVRDRSRRSLPEATSAPGPSCRLGLVDPTARSLATARDLLAKGAPWRGGADVWLSPQPLLADGAGQVAFVFPGLEAEFPPRLTDIEAQLGLKADDPDEPGLSGHGVELIRTGLLLCAALERLRIAPDALAGYSLGEWTAWAAAGIVDRQALYQLAAHEYESPDVSVVVVAGGGPDIEPRLAGYPGVVLSIDSAPNQSVLCGPPDQVDSLVAELRQDAILSRALPFRAGYHTAYFGPAARIISQASGLRPGQSRIPVWSATLAAPCPSDPAQLRDLFFRHLTVPVRFRATIRAMHKAGIRAFIQVGAGHLASVMHENLRDLDHLAIPANVSQRDGVSQLKRVAVALWAEGLSPDLSALGIGSPSPSISPARASLPVRLQLGSERISLGSDAASLLGASATVSHAASPPFAELRSFAASSPAAGELAVLLEETAQSAADVLSALGAPAVTAPAQPAAGPPAPRAGPPAFTAAAPRRSVLRVGLDVMPYLKDHCFFAQPANWPHMSDRWPVVPATAIIAHMIDAVESATAGSKVTEIVNAQCSRWVVAEPAQDIEITISPADADTVTVKFGSYARALVRTAQSYPEPPSTWNFDSVPATSPNINMEWYYENIAFHGQAYRGITRVRVLGRRQVSGQVRVPASPGAALDNGLQLVGLWLDKAESSRKLALPVNFGSISLWGPAPPADSLMDVIARIESIDNEEIFYSIQYYFGDRVWAQIDQGALRRFDSEALIAHPDSHYLAESQPEGWVMAVDTWTDAITPMLIANSALGTRGYAQYERQPLRGRRQWLLSRLAIKDAVRLRLREDGAGDVFPVEVEVADDQDGQPHVRGWAGRGLTGYRVSAACVGKRAVALARPGGLGHERSEESGEQGTGGTGIVIAQVDNAADDARQSALSDGEIAILRSVTMDSGERETSWAGRFQAAKNAAVKASGPHCDEAKCTIVAAVPGCISVEAAGHLYLVGYREFDDPGGPPPCQYIVTWTWGPGVQPDGRESR
jgi:acyl transferase domain-containing protein